METSKDPFMPERDQSALIVKVENGDHFVYLPNGEKIPYVVSTIVTQHLRDQPFCNFKVLYNASDVIGGNRFVSIKDDCIVLPSGNWFKPDFINILETKSNEVPMLEITVKVNLV